MCSGLRLYCVGGLDSGLPLTWGQGDKGDHPYLQQRFTSDDKQISKDGKMNSHALFPMCDCVPPAFSFHVYLERLCMRVYECA